MTANCKADLQIVPGNFGFVPEAGTQAGWAYTKHPATIMEGISC